MTNRVKKIDPQAAKHERELKARLAYNGYTQAAVARELGKHFTLVSQVIKGRKKSKRVLQFIEALPLTDRRIEHVS